jgi:hypothetical protein
MFSKRLAELLLRRNQARQSSCGPALPGVVPQKQCILTFSGIFALLTFHPRLAEVFGVVGFLEQRCGLGDFAPFA